MIEAELPDGRILEFPAGTSPDVIQKAVKGMLAPKENKGYIESAAQGVSKGIGDVMFNAQGLVGKGLEKLGADQVGQFLQQDAEQRKQQEAQTLAPYKAANPMTAGGGELAGEIIGTLPVGGALAKGVTKAASYAPSISSKVAPFATALQTGGLGAGAGGVGTRVAGGATLGATQGALIDSESPAGAVGGAVLGGAIPAVGAAARPAAEWLMKSALKPTLAQHQSGEAASAVKTLLDEGINATKGGAEKLKYMVQDIDQQIKDVISSSTATVDKQKVLGQLQGLRQRVLQQANPSADLAAVDAAGTGFSQHPLLPTDQIPIQLAQDLKQGTYREVGKKYGQIGSADIEAQKALARGLKEEIAQVAPEVAPLNARQSELIKALKVTGRRALMDENKNPLGLTALAPSGTGALAFLADRSALAKSLAARGINQLSPKDKQSILADLLRQTTVTSPAMIASD